MKRILPEVLLILIIILMVAINIAVSWSSDINTAGIKIISIIFLIIATLTLADRIKNKFMRIKLIKNGEKFTADITGFFCKQCPDVQQEEYENAAGLAKKVVQFAEERGSVREVTPEHSYTVACYFIKCSFTHNSGVMYNFVSDWFYFSPKANPRLLFAKSGITTVAVYVNMQNPEKYYWVDTNEIIHYLNTHKYKHKKTHSV